MSKLIHFPTINKICFMDSRNKGIVLTVSMICMLKQLKRNPGNSESILYEKEMVTNINHVLNNSRKINGALD